MELQPAILELSTWENALENNWTMNSRELGLNTSIQAHLAMLQSYKKNGVGEGVNWLSNFKFSEGNRVGNRINTDLTR